MPAAAQKRLLLLALALPGCVHPNHDPAISPNHPANPNAIAAPDHHHQPAATQPTPPATTAPAPASHDHSHHGAH